MGCDYKTKLLWSIHNAFNLVAVKQLSLARINDLITKRAKTLLQNAAAQFITKRTKCLLQNAEAFLLQNEPFRLQNTLGITK